MEFNFPSLVRYIDPVARVSDEADDLRRRRLRLRTQADSQETVPDRDESEGAMGRRNVDMKTRYDNGVASGADYNEKRLIIY
jgi:hypothetical protein